MTEYRVYVLDGARKISKSTDLDFASDEEAIRNVASLQSAPAMELWKGNELVKRFAAIVNGNDAVQKKDGGAWIMG